MHRNENILVHRVLDSTGILRSTPLNMAVMHAEACFLPFLIFSVCFQWGCSGRPSNRRAARGVHYFIALKSDYPRQLRRSQILRVDTAKSIQTVRSVKGACSSR